MLCCVLVCRSQSVGRSVELSSLNVTTQASEGTTVIKEKHLRIYLVCFTLDSFCDGSKSYDVSSFTTKPYQFHKMSLNREKVVVAVKAQDSGDCACGILD